MKYEAYEDDMIALILIGMIPPYNCQWVPLRESGSCIIIVQVQGTRLTRG